jgi:hypothetical protein
VKKKKRYNQTGQRSQFNTAHALRMTDNQGKKRNTHSEYVIIIAFPWQQWLRERALMLR